MIFKQWQQVLDGTKTQTRRLVKRHGEQLTPNRLYTEHSWPFPPTVLVDCRIKWRVGRDYAVQPGRGKKAVGRIRLSAIRSEPLWDIDGPDCLAEGLSAYDDRGMHKTVLDLFDEYAQLWDSIYGKMPGCSWDDNPDVWVLEFEVAQ